MRFRGIAVALFGLLLGGCVLTDTLDPVPETVMSPRDQKLIKSAVANATDLSKGQVDVDTLVVKHISVDQGPTQRRFMPRAMGRAPRVDDHGGEVYVYRRTGQPCHVCGCPVRTAVLDARNLFWCSRCQPTFRSRAVG
jgi:hypothetical protein